MLNRLETHIMAFLFSRCRGKRTVLISPDEILVNIAKTAGGKPLPRFEITRKQLDTRLKNLVLDGYIDFSLTDNKDGQQIYVLSLTTRGEAFQREHEDRTKKRIHDFVWQLICAAGGALVTFIVFKILGK